MDLIQPVWEIITRMNTIEYSASILEAENNAVKNPDDFKAYEKLGFEHFQAENYLEALLALQNAVALNPGTTDAYQLIGHIHYKVGFPKAAIAAYEQAIANDAHYIPAYYGIAVLHFSKTGQYDLAVEALQHGLVANPGDPFLTANLGNTAARQGNIDQAVEILEAVARTNPDDAFAFGFLGLLYLHLHRYDDVVKVSRRAIELEAEHYHYLYLGYANHARGMHDQAISELENALELAPEDYEVLAVLARVFRETGDPEASKEHQERAMDLAMKDNEYGQACFYSIIGETEKALDLLEIGLVKGQLLPGWARIDPELAFIRDAPRFQAMVNQS